MAHFERWVEDGRPDTAQRAAGVADALREQYEHPPLDPAVDEALEALWTSGWRSTRGWPERD